MSDFERRLRDALHATGDDYAPADEASARDRFFRRRRRRRMAWASGTAVASAAATAAVFLLAPGTVLRNEEAPVTETALRPVVAASIGVGDEPYGLVHTERAVWVADRGGAAVWKIDPASNAATRIAVAPGPDDLIAAGGYVWVVHPDADVLTRIDARRAVVVNESPIPGRGEHLDLARAPDALWVLEEGGMLLRYDLSTGRVSQRLQLDDDPADVAVAGDRVWVYARGAGEVRQFDAATGQAAGAPALVGPAEHADLAAGLGALWFYGDGDGKLLRIDLETATVEHEVPLGGAYAGLAVGEGAVWAVVGDGEGLGALYQIEASSARPVGGTVPLTGRPIDLDVGSGAVWVTQVEAGTVTRLDLVAMAVGDVAETEEPALVPVHEVVLYASDGRDVVALLRDGTRRRVAATAAPEVDPAVTSDGRSLVLQRGTPEGPDAPVLVEVDLAEGGSREIASGTSPAVAANGTLAWLEAEPDGKASVVLRTGGETHALGTFEAASSLAWSPDGRRLAIEVGPGEGRRVLLLDAAARALPSAGADETELDWTLLGSDEVVRDASLRAPLPEAGVTFLLRACCLGPDRDFESLELGRVDDDGSYQKIKGLDDFGLDPNAARLWLVDAGRLDYEADDGWKTLGERAWLISDGRTLLLLDEKREGDVLPVESGGGVAINPLALRP